MTQQDSRSTTYRHYILVVVLVLLISVGISIFTYASLSQKITTIKKDSYNSNEMLWYQTEKLTFCIDHKLTVCDDGAISTWNTENPESPFVLKTDRQLVEQAIDRERLENYR